MADGYTSFEQQRFSVITSVLRKEIKPGLAGKLLGVSPRQVRRLREDVRKRGIAAVVHGLKGKLGNHHIDIVTKEKALQVIRETYRDFKPGFATEKLEQNHQIRITSQTTRVWMSEAGLWKTKRQKQSEYHSWRPRKEYFGEMQQFDGSYHLWFENRFIDEKGIPIEVCLLASIDDATGQITQATFSENEGVHAVFAFWKTYSEQIGKPISIYLDKFSTYKVNHKAAVDNSDLITQFQRAMKSLSIELITAHSPQAKGRVERLFQTLQDRLIKEMRLVGISTPEEGNTFLKRIFIPKFNEKFSVLPAKEGSVHTPLTIDDKQQINHIFSIQETRKVNNDFTIQFKNNWYQLQEVQPTTVRARSTILMEEWLDGKIHIVLNKHDLSYMVLPEKPQKQNKKQPLILTTHKLNWKPPPSHPWKRLSFK